MSLIYDGTVLTNVTAGLVNLVIKDFTTEIYGKDSDKSIYYINPKSIFYDVRDTLKTIECEPNCQLESLPNYCFLRCTKLEKADFSNCNKLKTFGYSVFDLAPLYEINLPPFLEMIGDTAFSYTHFQSITIPKTVTYIGVMAFYYASLKTITFEEPSSITSFGISIFISTDIENI